MFSSRLALALVGVLAVSFLVQLGPRLNGPFGASHDGFNGSMWSIGSRELRTRGVLASKLGADFDADLRARGYAHHPPLIYLTVATSELIFGERPVATRLPVVVASFFLVFATFFLLCEMRIHPLPAALAVCLAFSGPMFFVYGALTDTAMLALVFATVLLLLWQRRSAGKPVAPVVIGLAAAAASLASWQGMVVAMLLSLLALWRLRKGRDAVCLAVILGTFCAVVAVFAWVFWVYGSFGELRLASSGRFGESVGLWESLRTQAQYARSLFPLTYALVPFAFVAALTWRSARAVGVIAVTVVVGYGLVFRNGALVHDYWNYWLLLPIGIGLAVLVERVSGWVAAPARTIAIPVLGVAVIGVGLALSALAPARRTIVNGQQFGRLIANSVPQWPPSQQFAFYEDGQPFGPVVTYYTRRPPRLVRTNQIAEWCTEPDFLFVDVSGRPLHCGPVGPVPLDQSRE